MPVPRQDELPPASLSLSPKMGISILFKAQMSSSALWVLWSLTSKELYRIFLTGKILYPQVSRTMLLAIVPRHSKCNLWNRLGRANMCEWRLKIHYAQSVKHKEDRSKAKIGGKGKVKMLKKKMKYGQCRERTWSEQRTWLRASLRCAEWFR